MKQALIRQWYRAILWAGRVFRGHHRLEKLAMLPLLTPIAALKDQYGDPVDSKAHGDFPETTEYSFEASLYHGIVAYEWNGLIQCITYWSAFADPARDLACMREGYGEGQTWNPLTEGYLYQRDDGKVRLWCSAVPAIGVATADYLAEEGKAKKQRRSSQTE